MKGKLACVLVITMFILMAVPATSANVDAEYEKELPSNAEVKFTDRSVAVLSDSSVGNSISSALSQSTSKLNVMDSISVANAKDITIIDSAWAATKEADVINNGVKTLIESNKAVILLDDSPDLIKQSGADINYLEFVDNAQAYGIINTTSGQTYCYSILGCNSPEEAMVFAYNWADEKMSNAYSQSLVISGLDKWTHLGSSRLLGFCDPYGFINVDSDYYTWNHSPQGYNYFCTVYTLEATPYSGYSKKEMSIQSNPTSTSAPEKYQELIKYGPSVTGEVSNSVPVNLSVLIGQSHGLVQDIELNWSYSIPDELTIVDESDQYNNKFYIRHMINECKTIGYSKLSVNPGLIVRSNTDGGGNYSCHELYDVEFCKVVEEGYWHNQFKHFTVNVDKIFYV